MEVINTWATQQLPRSKVIKALKKPLKRKAFDLRKNPCKYLSWMDKGKDKEDIISYKK